MNNIWQRVQQVLSLPWDISDDRRRGRILNVLLWVTTVLVVLFIAAFLLAVAFGKDGSRDKMGLVLGMGAAVLLVSLLLFWLNRFSPRLSSWLFVLMLLVSALLVDILEKTAGGRSQILLMIPVTVASILLAPYMGFVVACVGALTIAAGLLYFERMFEGANPVTAMAVLLVMSLLIWLVTHLWERTLKGWRSANRNLDLLYRAGRALSSTLSLDEVLLTVLREIHRFLDVAACSVWLVDPQTGELVCWQSTDPNSELFRGWRLSPTEGLVGQVAQSGESLIVPDAQLEPQHYKGLEERSGLQPRSILSVPLHGRQQQAIGVLQVLDTDVDRFGPADLTLLAPLITSAASAIENARLYDRAQQEITERRRAEEQLKDAQSQLTQLAKSAGIGQLAAGMARELDSSLSSILDYATAVAEDTAPEKIPEHLGMIAAEARQVQEVVRNLLDFADQGKPRKELQDVQYLLEQTLAVLRPNLEKGGIVLERDYAPDIPAVLIDAGQMKQVFLNLLSNALQAMPEGGALRVGLACKDAGVAVAFHDTGLGIPADVRERIFDPFFTTKATGAGLGLATSSGIVREHGGHIAVESEEGQGSTFTLWLPLVEPPEA